jgi:hypothetical protein
MIDGNHHRHEYDLLDPMSLVVESYPFEEEEEKKRATI